MSWFNKLIDDTLKNKDGIWSRKSLTTLVTFIFVMSLGTYIVVSDSILKVVINGQAIIVFQSLLAFLIALMGLTEISKKFENKQMPPEE